MTRPRTIAIDGPVASGKSAVGRMLAGRLGYAFLDTGLMYRAVTLAAVRAETDVNDSGALVALLDAVDITVRVSGQETRLLLNGEDVTELLRAPEVERVVSFVSQVAEVRRRMVEQQRAVAAEQPVVMVGRDIGTVVLPDADLKVYLDASVEERARRRHAENVNDQQTPLESIEAALRERDRIDSGREISPLRPSPDAHIINTDGLTVDGVVATIERLIES